MYTYDPVTHAVTYDATTPTTWAQEMERRRLSVRVIKHNGRMCYCAEALHHDKYEWAAGSTAEIAVLNLVQRIREAAHV